MTGEKVFAVLILIVAMVGLFNIFLVSTGEDLVSWYGDIFSILLTKKYVLVQEFGEGGNLVNERYEDEAGNTLGEAVRRRIEGRTKEETFWKIVYNCTKSSYFSEGDCATREEWKAIADGECSSAGERLQLIKFYSC